MRCVYGAHQCARYVTARILENAHASAFRINGIVIITVVIISVVVIIDHRIILARNATS